jgi:threonine dehydratase
MNKPITEMYEELPQIAKILLQIFFGGFIGGVYRILRYLETKNIVTLVVGILCRVTGVGDFVAWLVDLVTVATKNRITVLAD